MNSFHLRIITPDGILFEGVAQSLTVRTLGGEMGILAGHTDCTTLLAQGTLTVTADGSTRQGRCNGGILTVLQSKATVLSRTFQWISTGP